MMRPAHLWPCVAALVGPAFAAQALDFQNLWQCTPPAPTVYCGIGQPALSPDGRCLAYTNTTTWPPYYEWWPAVGLISVEPDGCEPLRLVEPSPGGNWCLDPAWSPDGVRLAFVSAGWDAEACGLWTLDLRDPESPGALQHVLACDDVAAPAWSRDGGTLAYAGAGGIHTIPSSGGSPTLLVADATFPSWGPDGQLAFVRDLDLWIRAADGTERQLTDTPDTETEPAWSPQGGWIAYASNRSGSWDVWIVAAGGGTPVQLTASPASESSPSWSAAADRLAFLSTTNTTDSVWLATDLPEWTTPVRARTWSAMKQLYR